MTNTTWPRGTAALVPDWRRQPSTPGPLSDRGPPSSPFVSLGGCTEGMVKPPSGLGQRDGSGQEPQIPKGTVHTLDLDEKPSSKIY